MQPAQTQHARHHLKYLLKPGLNRHSLLICRRPSVLKSEKSDDTKVREGQRPLLLSQASQNGSTSRLGQEAGAPEDTTINSVAGKSSLISSSSHHTSTLTREWGLVLDLEAARLFGKSNAT